MNDENAFSEIIQSLASSNEWLVIHSSGNAFALKRDEIELAFERGKILCGFLDDKGFKVWRVRDYKIEPEKLTLDLTRNFGRERERIRIVPRVSAGELSAAVELARLEKANQIAQLIIADNPQSKLVRVALNKENGRFAQIIFESSNKNRTAVLSDVADCAAPENLLTTAILWFVKLQIAERIRLPRFGFWRKRNSTKICENFTPCSVNVGSQKFSSKKFVAVPKRKR